MALLKALFCAAVFLIIPFATAQAQSTSLVKLATQNAVYAIDSEGQRHAFPTEWSYTSWFGKDFSSVNTITSEAIAHYPLGKNVTAKPGTLIKFMSDPRLYVVAAPQTLRWVRTEADAALWFGDEWASSVHTLPEIFFEDYSLGSPLEDTLSTIALFDDVLRRHPTHISLIPITLTPNWSISIFPSTTTIAAGKFLTWTARAEPLSHVENISVFINGKKIGTCETSPCIFMTEAAPLDTTTSSSPMIAQAFVQWSLPGLPSDLPATYTLDLTDSSPLMHP
jgi:hypothetical protein